MAKRQSENENVPEAKRRRNVADELQHQILLKLPIEAVIGLRPVCREWRDMSATTEFRAMWREAHAVDGKIQVGSLAIRSRYAGRKYSRCYSTDTKMWYTIPNTFFLPKDGFHLKDCKRGLAAARLTKQMAVGNPVTGEWVYFNRPLGMKQWAKSPWCLMVPETSLTQRSSQFSIFVNNFIYDSEEEAWRHAQLPTAGGAYGSVYSDGISLYYLCEDGDDVKLLKASVKRETGRNRTRVENVATCRMKFPKNHRLIKYRNRIGMVVYDEDLGVSVMVLGTKTQKWKLKSNMPIDIREKVIEDVRGVKFSGGSGRFTFVAGGATPIGMFDTLDNSWHCIDDQVEFDYFVRKSDFLCIELSF